MTNLFDKVVTIRKPHQCWGCGAELKKGSSMRVVETVDNGEFGRAYWCKQCDDFVRGLADWQKQDGFAFGEVLEMRCI